MDSQDRHDEVSQYEQSAHFNTVMNAVIILCFDDMQGLLMLMKEYNQNHQNSFQHLHTAFNTQGQASGYLYSHAHIHARQ